MVEKWIKTAKELGFSEAAALDPVSLRPMQAVRDMCAANKCGVYGKNWTCPPAIGSLSECEERLQTYKRGILLQTTGQLRKSIDVKAYEETEKRHLLLFQEFSRQIKEVYPEALCLGAGGCRVCKTCAYPEACRFPEKAYASMEGYGLFVTQVCRDNNLGYYYGEKTITYTACVLF